MTYRVKSVIAALCLCALCACGKGKENGGAQPETVAGEENRTQPQIAAAAAGSTMAPEEETFGPWEWDVNGDGTAETVEIALLEGEWERYGVRVTAGERSDTWDTAVSYRPRLRIEDLDGDGVSEILFWGDAGSDDYELTVLRWNQGFTTVPFAGKDGDDRADLMYGVLEAVEGNAITVGSWQYVLGTYGGRRRFELGEDGVFRPAAGSIWEFAGNETYLTTTRELSGAMDDGTSAIPAGARLRLLGWDGVSQVYFETGDGVRGTLAVSRGEEYGWQIGGVREEECFAFLPYAG